MDGAYVAQSHPDFFRRDIRLRALRMVRELVRSFENLNNSGAGNDAVKNTLTSLSQPESFESKANEYMDQQTDNFVDDFAGLNLGPSATIKTLVASGSMILEASVAEDPDDEWLIQ